MFPGSYVRGRCEHQCRKCHKPLLLSIFDSEVVPGCLSRLFLIFQPHKLSEHSFSHFPLKIVVYVLFNQLKDFYLIFILFRRN